ncbi:MAG: NAD-dependent epimerase/dehydratase family protein [Caulobacteraceae bacterium]
MRALVTGSAGHLGEALALMLAARGDEVVGLDRLPSRFTTHIGSIADPALVARAMEGVEAVFHAATLHKPHVASHGRQAFIDTNITGTNALLNAALAAKAQVFVFTSTTSVFGEAMAPEPGAPAVWVDESLPPRPRNIYGATKLAAEELVRLAAREDGLACVILRAARFFPEEDDDPAVAAAFAPDNVKLNEFLYRRLDIEDVASAHLLAAERAREVGTGPFILSAASPFTRDDVAELARDAPAVAARRAPEYEAVYQRLGWRMFETIGRVYAAGAAQAALGWRPKHDFRSMLARVATGKPPMSELALAVGSKGYHRRA